MNINDKDNLLSAPSSNDKDSTENLKYSSPGLLSSVSNSIKSLFYGGPRKYNVPKRRNNLTMTSNYNTTDYVLDDNVSSQPITPPAKTTTKPKSKKTTSSLVNASTFIFGLSLSFFMQLLLLIIVLAILGINIFHYLGYGLEVTGDVVENTGDATNTGLQTTGKAIVATGDKVEQIGNVSKAAILPVTKKVVKQTALVTGSGIKGLTDVTVNAVDKSVDLVTGETGTDVNQVNSSYINKSKYVNDTIDKALEKQPPKQPKEKSEDEEKTEGLSGWCYIGSEGGVRSCASLSEGVSCISGEIFGSREVCINPNLRE